MYCHEGGWTSNGSSIVCTQPRRLAAITVATRVAEEYGCSIGEQVGYGVRFDYKCSSLTKIKYYTDGILLRETLSDPLLSKYSIIIIDEAHQRSLNSDILLGLLKKIQKKRSQMNILNDFKIIITSATLDANLFKQFFELNHTNDPSLDTATILSVQGRQHPVDIFYLNEPCRNYVSKCLETLINIHTYEEWGDILIFLPGSEEIDLLIRLFQEEVDKYHASQYYQSSKKGGGSSGAGSSVDKSLDTLYILPLYSTLPQYLQVKVFESTPYHMRKVIVATNIAESSITIENVKYVIDSGFVKLNFFDVTSGIESLITCPVTKSNAMQRSGRAGRSQAGKCYRLMTEITYDALQDYPLVEMQRSDLSFMILQLKSLGIKDLLHFDFLSPPSSALMIYALELLYNLQAINEKGDITLLGLQMAEMPIEPKLSKCLIASLDYGCTEEMLSIIAMLLVEYPFHQMKHTNTNTMNEQKTERMKKLEKDIEQYCMIGSDHLTLLNVYQGYQSSNYSQSYCDSNSLLYRHLNKAKEIRSNLLSLVKKFVVNNNSSNDSKGKYVIASCGDDDKTIRKCLIAGFFSYVAKLSNRGKYQLLRGGKYVEPHPFSVLTRYGSLPEYVLFNDVVYNNTSSNAYYNAVGGGNEGGGRGNQDSQIVFMREISRIDPLWLADIASHYYDLKL